ncbi:hypothetical protein BC939DRAFT_471583 [Gamsiella multidivaricata]|uniref:uncharacterized protein n=1 Tax=Gamsiella multidivaricata TaxID=101098 RepID=UPI00221F6742|nr:uncharacterized protein BC939DRAFT_471583 [Gamsiella multidivaricata]KAI7815799.1 hypothetical protein BC939DRAFT_471583 [Gamsiella multidivaricata]
MATFDDALTHFSNLLHCPLCENELQSTHTVKECGHHFCEYGSLLQQMIRDWKHTFADN